MIGSKDIRIVDIPLPEVPRVIEEYLIRQPIGRRGWKIVNETYGDHHSVRAINREPDAFILFQTREPQTAVWDIYPEKRGVRIEFMFQFNQHYRSGLFTILTSLAVLGFVSLITDKPTVSAFLGLALASLIWWVIRIDKYVRFKEDFYSTVYQMTGSRPVLIAEGQSLPHFRYILLFVGTFVALFAAPFLELYRLPSGPKLFLQIALVAVILCAALVVALIVRPHDAGKLNLYFPFWTTGSVIAIYSFIPLVFTSLLKYRITVVAVLMALMSVALFVRVLQKVPLALVTLEKRRQSSSSSESPPESGLEDTDSRLFIGLILAFWFTCTASNLLGLYFSVVGLIHFPTAAKVAIGIYALPLFALSFLSLRSWLGMLREAHVLRRKSLVPQELNLVVDNICTRTQTNAPIILVEDRRVIFCYVYHVPLLGSILRVSTQALESLTNYELQAVLAHEIWHLKRHSRLFALLGLISLCSLFGKGFLIIIFNTKQLEYKADEAAVKYLASVGVAKTTLITALEKVVVQNEKLRYLAPSRSLLSFSENELPTMGSSMTLESTIRLLYEIYFGDRPISYTHPTIDDRIRRIEAMS